MIFLKSVYLRNFRNYVEEEISFSPRLNLFFGKNAQGKTNLLEAVYLIATGRSFRTAHLHELIREGERFFFLDSVIMKDGIEHKVQISFDGKTKKLTLDGNSYSSFQHLLGLLPSVLNTPWDQELISGSPSVRRRFLNLHLAQKDPLYIHHLARYWRAMKQRNALLKAKTSASIECWEIEMAESASYLGKKRQELALRLQKPLQVNGNKLSLGNEVHEISFVSSADSNFLEQLKRNRAREMHLGATLTGPHRDDFTLWVNQRPARSFASEGQKKTALFGLRLAEWELFEDCPAIYGIDDLSAHLDSPRETLFQTALEKLGQVFLTATFSRDLPNANLFSVENGKVN